MEAKRLALGGLLAAVVTSLTACSSPSTDYTQPHVSDSAATSLPKPATSYIFGQIVAETPEGWTIKGIRGNTYAVRLTAKTDYGSLFHRANRAQFKIGDNVRVAGIFVGTAVTANAVDFSKPPTH
jgi:hypothetical protein